MVLWETPRQCSSWTLCEGFCWLLLLPVMLLIVARPVKLAAFPTSLSDCQTPTGWNCSGYDDRENDLFLCDTNTCKFDGECLRIGDTVTCVCQFKCNNDYVPVCGSNGESYQNECYLRQAACKQQSEILVVSEGSCATDAGSGSGDGVHEGSGETSQKETSTCDICQFGAECDEDAEDVWCVCNIDCSQTNFNPLCASDGKSYDNACQIKEASCQKQEKIEVMSLGRCQDNTTTTIKSEDGHYARTDYAENANKLEESAREHHIPCPEHYNGFCMHGKCEHSINMQEPSCRCDAGYTGQHCEKKDYSVLYVVPGPVRFQYVLIAAVIGTIQIAVICVVVLCITRNRGQGYLPKGREDEGTIQIDCSSLPPSWTICVGSSILSLKLPSHSQELFRSQPMILRGDTHLVPLKGASALPAIISILLYGASCFAFILHPESNDFKTLN